MYRALDLAGMRRSPLLIRLLGGLIAVALIWFGGLFWFAGQLPMQAEAPSKQTDAIVVLTGGSGRLNQGFTLLADKKAEKLFISGVYRGVDVEQLLELSQRAPAELECCVVLGYKADDTRGNAAETATWLREQGYDSIRLVTASYHMPRSLLEFRRTLPDIEIVSHAIQSENFRQEDWWRWPGSAALLASEFNKYLVALLRGPVDAEPS